MSDDHGPKQQQEQVVVVQSFDPSPSGNGAHVEVAVGVPDEKRPDARKFVGYRRRCVGCAQVVTSWRV